MSLYFLQRLQLRGYCRAQVVSRTTALFNAEIGKLAFHQLDENDKNEENDKLHNAQGILHNEYYQNTNLKFFV